MTPARVVQAALLLVAPQGGQGQSRRNAQIELSRLRTRVQPNFIVAQPAKRGSS